MGYATLKKLNGSDVENVLEFCNVISGSNKPYHVEFLEVLVKAFNRKIPKAKLENLIVLAYARAIEKHVRANATGPAPNIVQYFGNKCLRYRPVKIGSIITLDLYSKPAILLVQGYNKTNIAKLARKLGTCVIFKLENSEVLFPNVALNLQLPIANLEFTNEHSVS